MRVRKSDRKKKKIKENDGKIGREKEEERGRDVERKISSTTPKVQ